MLLKITKLIFIFLLSAKIYAAEKDCLADIECRNSIRLRLLDMYESDQGIRQAALEGEASDDDVVKADVYNQNELKDIIQLIGWPTAEKVGQIGAEAATSVAIHATNDADFQDQVLNWMAEDRSQPGFDLQSYYLLYDKILVEREGVQRYGTQGWCDEDSGEWQFYPILEEYRAEVEGERAKAFLPTLEQYADLVTSSFCQAG